MPAPTPNSTVRYPMEPITIELGPEYDAEICKMLGLEVLPEGLKPTLEHLIGYARQRILTRVPTNAEGERALQELLKALDTAVHWLGHAGDASAGQLAHLRRSLPGGFTELRRRQAEIESLAQVVEQLQHMPLPHDLAPAPTSLVAQSNAKISMAAGLADLLNGNGIRPTTTVDSPYMLLVAWALIHVDPKGPGDERKIAAKGLRAWRG